MSLGEQRWLAVAVCNGALPDWAAVLLKLEERKLLPARMDALLLATKLEHIAPEIAPAIDVDESEASHDPPHLRMALRYSASVTPAS